jgi:YHS domain-containing protein
MLRLVLFVVLAIFVARAFWRLFDAVVEGASGGRARNQVPERGAHMVRDPVCGTFVLPNRALMLGDGRERVYFCSDACRDKFRSPRATSTGESTEGRTA